MTCAEVRETAAAALLAGEPLPSDVDRHLVTCAACRDEVAELSATVSLLARTGPDVLPAPEPPDPALLGRLIAEAAHRRRGRRRATMLAVAVAACIVLLAAVAGAIVVSNARNTPAAVVATGAARDATTGVAGTARLTQSTEGSQVAFTAVGVEPGTVCTVRVVTRDGVAHPVMTWTADYLAEGKVTATTVVPASSITRVELVDGSGRILVPVPVTPA